MTKPSGNNGNGNCGRVIPLTHTIAAVILVLLAVMVGVRQAALAESARCDLLAAKDAEIEKRVTALEDLMRQSMADRQQLNIKLAVIQAVIGTVGEQVGVSPARIEATKTQAMAEAKATQQARTQTPPAD